MTMATTDAAEARLVVDKANRAIGPTDVCIFCPVMIAVPSAITCAKVGDLDEARRHLAMAEHSATAWQGTAWPGAVAEVKAHIACSEGFDDEAGALFGDAGVLFDRAGQPLDARRCRES